MTLLIDREGRIAVSHTGMVDKDDWESKIRLLLKWNCRLVETQFCHLAKNRHFTHHGLARGT